MASPIAMANQAQALEKTREAIERNTPWYQTLLIGAEEAEATAGETLTKEVIAGFELLLDAANVSVVTPVCVGLSALFDAVEGATAARQELIDLLSYCVSITSIILENARMPELPPQIQMAVKQVIDEIDKIAKFARQFDGKVGCCLPCCRRLCSHARDRSKMKTHKRKLEEILKIVTSAAMLDAAANLRIIRAKMDLAVPEDMATDPPEAPTQPSSYVERTALVSEIVSELTGAGPVSDPYVLFGTGGAGKTVLASSVVRNPDIRRHFRGGIFWLSVGRDDETQLLALLEGLAAKVIVDPMGPRNLDDAEGVIQSLTAAVAESDLPRLVVVDDVWKRDVVDKLAPTGLRLLVTTRDRAVLAAAGGYMEVGSMSQMEARELLKKRSSAGALPEREADQVADECGRLAMALAIAGSPPCVTESPNSAQYWDKLHLQIKEKKKAICSGTQTGTGTASDPSEISLFAALSIRLESFGHDARNSFLSLVVLRGGVVASTGMLMALWGKKDHSGARKEAEYLACNALLHEVGNRFRLHGQLFDFIKNEYESGGGHELVDGVVKSQTQYLGRLSVVKDLVDGVVKSQTQYLGRLSVVKDFYEEKDLYTPIRLWRSLEELSNDTRLEAVTYGDSLGKLGEAETIDVADAYTRIGKLFRLQGKYADAAPLYKRCQEIQEKVLGSDNASFAATLHSRAEVLQAQGMDGDAEPLYKRCHEIQERVLDPGHPSLTTTLKKLVELLTKRGKYTEGVALCEGILRKQKNALGEGHKRTEDTERILDFIQRSMQGP